MIEAIIAYLVDHVIGFVKRHPWLTAALVIAAVVGPPVLSVLAWLRIFSGANRLGDWLGKQLVAFNAWLTAGKAPRWWIWVLALLPGGFIVVLWVLLERAKIKRSSNNMATFAGSGDAAGTASPAPAAGWDTVIQPMISYG